MKGFMITRVSGLALLMFFGQTVSSARLAAFEPTRDDGPARPSARKFQFQELEDPVETLVPREQRTASEEARIDALAWFAAGRIRQHRGDFPGALDAYQKAIERDPMAVAVYRVLIPLAIELRRNDDAAKWAAKAVELIPGDQQLLMQAAALLINRDDLPGAIRVLEKAAKSPGIDPHSAQYVNIMRDLAVLNMAVERPNVAAAAAGFEVVFDALVNPDKYKLDFRTRAQLQSNEATSYERMGKVFLDAKKTDLALAAFKKAADSKKGPSATALSYNLAQVYMQASDPQHALEEIQKYIDSQRISSGRAAYELFAEILAKLDKSAELIPRLEKAAEKDSRNSALQFYLAEQYAAANRLEDAETLYKKTLESSSEVPGYVGLAAVYRRQNRPADLLEILSKGYAEAGDLKGFAAEFKAVAADEMLLDKLVKSGEELVAENPSPLDFATGYVLANLAADGKKTEAAEKLYRFLLSLRKERAALIYEELGSLFVEVRKFAEAAKVYQEAADDPDLDDNRANFLFMATQALELSGNTKAALEAIAAAQEIMPNNPLLRYQEGWVYYHSHQFEPAIERMEKLIADFPVPQARQIVRRAQYSLSNIYVLQGEMRKGEEILEAIYAEDPDDTSVNNDLGYLYADQGKNLEQAERMIRKALDAEPENGAYLDSLGWVLFKREKYEEALPYLEKAVKNSPGAGDETLWEHLAEVCDRLQQPARALESWKKALEYAEKAQFPDKKLIERVKEKIASREKDAAK
jgi:tetratricopeptide (TPR) repeat protein